MTQKRKNIQLLVIWIVLIILTAAIYRIDAPTDRLSVSRDLFALRDPSMISKVVLNSGTERNTLVFDGVQWQLNGKYSADPQRVTVLFAILKQNKVRRVVAQARRAEVDSLMKIAGVYVQFFQGENVVKQFKVVSSADGSLTYFSSGEEQFVVEIPGYRVNLGGMFSLDENGWRNPLVFDVSWTNLEEVRVIYPEKDNSFNVVYNNRYYDIQQLGQTDSTKLTDFLDGVSLLLVDDYLYPRELDSTEYRQPAIATLMVNVLGDEPHSVEFWKSRSDPGKVIGRIDSLDYAVFDYETVRKLLRPRRYFIPGN